MFIWATPERHQKLFFTRVTVGVCALLFNIEFAKYVSDVAVGSMDFALAKATAQELYRCLRAKLHEDLKHCRSQVLAGIEGVC